MTTYLKLHLRRLTEQWRVTAQKTRTVVDETPDPIMQGHLHGISDGLLIAAEDVDKLLDKPDGVSPT